MSIVNIIIPVHNDLEDTIKCIESIRKQTDKNYKIVIVDDGSTDGSRAYIKSHYSEIILLEGDGNLWCTGSVKKGVDYILNTDYEENDYIMTLNNDLLCEENMIQELRSFATKNLKSIAGAISIDKEDMETIISSGSKVISWFFAITNHPHRGKPVTEINDTPISVDMLHGRGILIPIKVFEQVGNYDNKHFPHYGGDNEFSFRAKKNGWHLYIVPSARLYLNKSKTGLNPNTRRLSFKEILTSFVSIKSTNNIATRTRFALRCCPLYALPTFLMIVYAKMFIQSILSLLRQEII